MTMTAPMPAAMTGRFDIGRVGRETFGLIQADLLGTYGLAAGLGVVPAILTFLLTATGMIAARGLPGPTFGQTFGLGLFLTAVVGLVVSLLIFGSLGWGAVEQLHGRKPTIGQKLSAAGAALLPMIGVGLLAYLGIAFASVFLLVPGLFLATMWSVVIVATVVERPGVFGAFSRSAALTRSHRWMIFVLFLIFFVIAFLLFAVQMVLMRAFVLAGPVAVTLITGLFGIVVGGAINALGAVGAGVVYQELRRAKGEFDPGRLAEVFS